MATLHGIKQRNCLACFLSITVHPLFQDSFSKENNLMLQYSRTHWSYNIQPCCSRDNIPHCNKQVSSLRGSTIQPKKSTYKPKYRSMVERNNPRTQKGISHGFKRGFLKRQQQPLL
ncbi:hypothetical protein ACB098_01G096000 [Castanea mollissima]